MSEPLSLKFAKNVEFNRQKLIEHCFKHGQEVSTSDTLDAVVDATTQINSDKTGFKIEFFNLDGSYCAPTQYVQKGGSGTFPDIIPEFDTEYLEFDRWQSSIGYELNNIQQDVQVGPLYKTKYDESIGQRPTYLFCECSANYEYSFNFNGTRTNAYIDWGDGIVEAMTQTIIPHTYTESGLKIIKIWGDEYPVGAHNVYGLFSKSTSNSDNVLKRAYIGENCTVFGFGGTSTTTYDKSLRYVTIPHPTKKLKLWGYGLKGNFCRVIVFPNGMEFSGSALMYSTDLRVVIFGMCPLQVLDYCFGIEKVIIPPGTTSIPSNGFKSCSSLREIILSETLASIMGSAFSGCDSLQELTLPKSVETVGASFQSCYGLKDLTVLNPGTQFTQAAFGDTSASTRALGLDIHLPQDYNCNIWLYNITSSERNLIDIAFKLRDNSNDSVKTITLSTILHEYILTTTYVNSLGEIVDSNDSDATLLLNIFQNKNWTVTLI